ncbi:hypothetical protein SeMB42_g01592 [Synchytrium endobioticum]|uniref:Uncharacterized protein n=1 Tax=Synchytrium endobioticum TaxID=286115 RepID=A0A507DKK0_9FUNG|nr:hypothetical protein SeMB42_g01592 [Synchytrium endobioticum]
METHEDLTAQKRKSRVKPVVRHYAEDDTLQEWRKYSKKLKELQRNLIRCNMDQLAAIKGLYEESLQRPSAGGGVPVASGDAGQEQICARRQPASLRPHTQLQD